MWGDPPSWRVPSTITNGSWIWLVACPLQTATVINEIIKQINFMAVIELLNYVICSIPGKDYI
jgi:hypothetical protein